MVAITTSAPFDSAHTCALLSDGSARCWGMNDHGQLGDATTANSSTPVAVCASGSGPGCVGGSPLGGVAAISAGSLHTCALRSDGRVACWGYNFFGQLGDNTTTERHTPVYVVGMPPPVGGIAELPDIAAISAEDASAPAEGCGWSAGKSAALAGGLAAAILVAAAGGWYARRRWVR